MRPLVCIVALVISFSAYSQQVNIIPQPASVKQPRIAASFTVSPATQIVLEGSGLEKIAAFFNDYLQRFYLFKLKVVKNTTSKNAIRLNYERMDNAIEGAYTLTVDGKGVYIAGDNANGVFYGIQSLIQLLPVPDARLKMRPNSLKIAYVNIDDAPRFAYRGLHLDVGRHFMPVDFIKRYIDYIALHKMNYFHWHLTEDQGWRIEIKKYPDLTKVGGWRNGTIIGRYPGTGNDNIKYGGYYTQQQVKEIVQYAADRYITVVPEIELPGHGSAAIAAYPSLSCFPDEKTKIPDNMISSASKAASGKLVQETWGVFDDVFCAGKDETFTFLQDVMDEILALFPSKYIHVGGDECPKANWKRCANCQKRMKDHNLKDEHELQSYFIQRMEKYLNAKGRTLIGWDEILEGGLAPKAIVMSWRGEEGGIAAAKQNHEVIMTPGNPVYFDHTQSENEDSVTIGGFNPIEKVYAYEPIPKELNAGQAKYVLGAQANMWTEYMKNTKKVEYMLFPRLGALSEVLWTQKEKKNWDDFEKRLQLQFKRYDLWNTNYSKAYFDIKATITPNDDNTGLYWTLNSNCTDCVLTYGVGKTDNTHFTANTGLDKGIKLPVSADTELSALLKKNAKPLSQVSQKFFFNKATGKKIKLTFEPSNSYPGDGAFTLINGVQNDKGRGRSKEFLGFNGTDCDAFIDFVTPQNISTITIHSFRQHGAWIWEPLSVEILASIDGQYFNSLGNTTEFNETQNGNGTMTINFKNVDTRFIKVIVKNKGNIPDGNPGAGNKAWLFVDEIEVN